MGLLYFVSLIQYDLTNSIIDTKSANPLMQYYREVYSLLYALTHFELLQSHLIMPYMIIELLRKNFNLCKI